MRHVFSPVYLEAAEGLVITERSHRDQRLARVGPTERPLAVRLAGRQNFERVYRPLVDARAVYDNSGPRPTLVPARSYHDTLLDHQMVLCVIPEETEEDEHRSARDGEDAVVIAHPAKEGHPAYEEDRDE